MSLDISLLPLAQQNQLKAFATQMEAAMDRARNEVASNSAGTQLKRWFGAADDQTKIEIRDKMSKLRSYMKNYKVQVKIDRNRPTNENALATHLTGGIVGDGTMNSLRRLDAAKAGLSGNVGTVDLSPNFLHLSNYATGPVATFKGQDRFQTIVHELSHIVLGTLDERLKSGQNAYTGVNARQLAIESPNKAKRNAENFGMFVEEFR